MALISAFVSYLVKYIVYIAVAVLGVVCGRKFKLSRASKKKAASE